MSNDIVAASVISGNRNFEGSRHARRARKLPRLAAAGRRLRAEAGTVIEDFTTTPIGHSAATAPCLFARHLADQPGSRYHHGRLRHPRHVPGETLRQRLRGRQALAGDRRHRQRDLQCWRRAAPISPTRRISTGMRQRPRRRFRPTSSARKPLAILGDSITTDHISPAGNIKAESPRRQIPDGAPGRQGRLQQLRRAPRPPRSDDARHLRQYPHQERNGPRHRGRL